MCMGREWPNLGGLAFAKTTDLSGSIFSRPCQKKKTDTVFITPAEEKRRDEMRDEMLKRLSEYEIQKL